MSVEIPKDLKDRLNELDINVSDAVRRCFIRIITREESIKKLEQVDVAVRERAPRLPEGTAMGLIREERDPQH